MNEKDEDSLIKRVKIVLVGDSSVGKTSIAQKFCTDEYTRQYTPTAGVDFYSKNLNIGSHKNVILYLWDISGLALHSPMLDKYLYCAELILLVYDVTNSSSFEILEEWIDIINTMNDDNNEIKPLMAIVGNKCDMEHQRTVKRDKSHRYAAEKGFIYNDISARTGESVSLCIVSLVAKLLGVELTKMDQDFHKPIVIAEIGDTVDISTIQKIVKRRPNKKTYQNNNYPTFPLSKSAVCLLQ